MIDDISLQAEVNDSPVLIEGTPGDDTLIGTGDDDQINGYDGHDYLRGNDGNDELNGGNGDDYLAGSGGDDTLNGDGGYDRAAYYNGAIAGVTVDLNQQGVAQNTGQGMDTLNSIEHLSGTAYGDTLTGDGGDNWLWGSTSYDEDGVYTGANNDTIDGGDGNDLLTVGIGNHVLTGGSGSDTVRFTENGAPESSVTISLALQGGAQATGNGSWTLSGIENLSGGLADDTLTGDGNDNILAGDAGNDSLSGGDGNDTLYGDGFINVDTHGVGTSGPIVHIIDGGAGGNDTLEGGAGNDALHGGGGIDTVSYANAVGPVEVNLQFGFSDEYNSDETSILSTDTLSGIENAIGSAFNDALIGDDNSNVLNGLGGHDILQGRGSDDTLYGGDGNDTLQGDVGELSLTVSGNDILYGENGNDSLRGGLGSDQLFGGDGNDHMRGNGGIDHFDGGADDGEGFNGIGDRISFYEQRATQGAVADLRTGIISNDGFGNVETMVGIESLGGGTAYADTFYGNDGRNFLFADLGDYVYGFDGDDLFQMGSAAAMVDGGDGIDTLFLMTSGGWLTPDANSDGLAELADAASAGWTVNLSSGFVVDGYPYFGNVTGFENVVGSELGDSITGDANANELSGMGGNDVVQGHDGHDTIYGGDGDDILRGDLGETFIGFGGNDVVHGEGGNDSLRGGLGDDQLYGGDNNDLLRGNGGIDYFDGGADDGEGVNGIGDRVSFYEARATQGAVADLRTGVISNDGFGNVETMVGIESLGGGTAYADTFYGNDDRNYLFADLGDDVYGFGGDDIVQMTSAAALVDGGDGTDRLDLYTSGGWLMPDIDADGLAEAAAEATSGWTVNLAAGTTLDGYGSAGAIAGFENVNGSVLSDSITGDANNNVLNGGDGDDTLEGGLGDDTLDGGNGIDTASYANASGGVEVNLGGGFAFGADGNDTLANIENAIGSEFDDGLVGNGGDNVLEGGGGNDTILGQQGNDTLDGGDGDDFASGGQGSDTIIGGAGADSLGGNQGDDTLYGGDGNDSIVGGPGNDTLYGGDGHDFLRGDNADGLTPGNDYIDAGAGFDRVTYYNTNNGITVSLLLQGTAQDTGQGMDTLLNTEAISGSVFSDTFIGDDNDNWFFIGGAGVDHHTVTSDNISANGGNDLIILGLGNHIADGGSGTDTLGFAWALGEIFGGVNVSLAIQGAPQDTGQGTMDIAGFENLSGSKFDDVFVGDNGDNLLAGNAGADHLHGGAGNDVLLGDGEVNMSPTNAGPPTVFNAQDYAAVDFYDSVGNPVFLFEGQDLYDADGNQLPRVELVDEFGDPYSQFTLNSVSYNMYVGFETGSDGVAGNDTLEGGLGDDTLDGGAGVDTATYANAGGSVFAFLYGGGFGEADGADGFDQLHNIENLTGSAFNDQLGGDDGDNVLDGGDGHDSLRGWGGNDTLLGGNGDDFVNGGLGDDTIDGGAGYDRAAFYTDATAGVTVDLNQQGVAQDTGQGLDTLIGIENLSGTIFGDTLVGDDSDNVLWGSGSTISPGNIVTTNNDTLSGGGGNDLLWLGIGNHVVDGGTGIDTFRFNENGMPETGITLSLLMQGTAQASGNGDWILTNIENLSGSIANDSLTGDGNDNVLAGDAGDDTLSGGGGNDTLYGDGQINWDTHGVGGSGPIITTPDAGVAGNDTLEGGLGDDTLDGGAGVDTATYANAGGSVFAFLYGGGFGEADGADGYDQLDNIENLTGSAFNDQLGGDDGNNVIDGGDGHDGLRGWGGNDTLLGGGGDDFLNGGLGDDTIDGGAGYDRAAFYTDATAGVTVDLNQQGVAQDTGQGMDTLIGIENVSGTVYGDTLIGDGNDNVLWGSASTISPGNIATTNNDTLSGGGGNDLLWVGIGNHVVDGGSGTDTFRFNENGAAETGIVLSLIWQGAAQASGNGSWTLTNIENLSGSTAGDSLTGDGNANVLAGDAGDDTLSGGAGNDTLYGDGRFEWDDHGTGGSGPIITTADGGGAGNDMLEGGLGNDIVNGGGGSDTASYANASGGVNVNLLSNSSSGADGNDTLSSIENLIGSAFADTLVGNNAANVLDGGDGIDTIAAFAGDDTLYGRSGNDSIYGMQGNDLIYGEDGNDNLRGGTGDDFIDGGTGFNLAGYFPVLTDTIGTGVTVDLNLQGSAQNTGQGMDTLVNIQGLSGTQFNDTLIGDDNTNLLIAAGGGLGAPGGDDQLFGNGGDDLLIVGSGNVLLDGGSGNDTVSFNAAGAPLINGVTVSLGLQGSAQATGSGNMTLTGIENLSGTGLADTLTGDGGDNILAGVGGDDVLTAGAGNDYLLGDGVYTAFSAVDGTFQAPGLVVDATIYAGQVAGNDLLEGGLGDDMLDGGAGIDTASYANAAGGVNVNLGGGFAFGADGNDTLANIENAIGSEFSDSLTGSGGNNVLEGLGGNDTLTGGAGDDTLHGGDGDDFLQGDFNENNISVTGNDVMYGGNGNDLLRGGLGDDQFYGGNNNDQFRGNGGVDYFDGGADDGEGVNGIGDRVSFFEQRATQGVIADLRTGIISNDGFGNVETMVGIESLGGDTAYVDTFYGNDGRNYLAGGRGDYVYGFGGDDWFQGISAAAVLDGGDGIDRLTLFVTNTGQLLPDTNSDGLAEFAAAATAGWTVNLAAGTTLDGYGYTGTIAGIENIDGTVLADSLTGDANANILNGGLGDDTIDGGDGDDTLDGGDGNDTASFASASGGVQAQLYNGSFGEAFGAAGYDQLNNFENLTGSAHNDSLTGNDQDNILVGGGGHDFLRGNAGNDNLQAGDGDDYLSGGIGDDVLDGGDGWDRVSFFAGAIAGINVDLRIQGVAQATGIGNDTLIGIEHVSGTAFSDVMIGDDGANWIWGTSDADGGNDTLDGQGGDDVIQNGAGDHVISGGSGIDTFAYSVLNSTTGINLNLTLQGAAQDTGVGMMTLTGIERLSGSIYADTLIGDGGDNLLAGGGGDDTLRGGAGNDVLYGDGAVSVDTHGTGASGPIVTSIDDGFGGNDLLEGGLGNDHIDGGGGTDTATYANASGSVNVNLNSGLASGADGSDTLANIENVIGSEFGDTLNGSASGNNGLSGLGGNDTINGHAGDDTLHGGDGNDFLNGDLTETNITVTGNDVIYGDNGNDNLRGGLGDDQMYGGANNDLLRGNGGVDYFDGGADDGLGFNGIGDRISFFEQRATQGVIADLRTGIISNDGFGNVESMVGIESLGADTAFVDTFYGNDGANFLGAALGDYLYGFGGDDRIQMGAAVAVVDGGLGIDLLGLDTSGSWLIGDTNGDGLADVAAAATAGWTVNLAAGTLVDGYGNTGSVTGIENVNGSVLGDSLTGDGNVNLLNGFDGDDVLNGRAGDDTIDGGNGTDTASYANAAGAVTVVLTATGGSSSGADGNDTLISIENATGGAFNDVVTGNGSANVLSGGDGHDSISGGAANDTLNGGNGNDSLTGGTGDDAIDGGAGFDRVNYNVGATAGVTVNLMLQGSSQVTGQGADTLNNIEHVVGTVFNDVITGDAGDNWLWGGSLGTGVTGNDTISGDDGNDLIEVGTGNHTLTGGNGTDTLSFLGGTTDITSAGVTFSLASAAAQNSEQGMISASGFENLSGSVHDDVFTGSTGDNVLAGNTGADKLTGGDGNDHLYGDGGYTVFTAGGLATGPIRLVADITTEFGGVGGDDTLLGGRGDDYLYGGRGNDLMTGNQGVDRFVIEAASGADRVTDYADNVDKIVFTSASGVDAFSDLTITKVGSNAVISWGTSDSLTLDAVKVNLLTASDFEFII